MTTDTLILQLAQDLKPVRKLAPPVTRIGLWLAAVLAIAVVQSTQINTAAIARHMAAAPDLWLAAAGSILTAIAAITATFLVSLPDRSPAWAFLPLPPFLLWIAASGLGCLRAPIAGMHRLTMANAMDDCLLYIIALSLPLAALLFLLLRRVATIRPELTTLTGGTAVAATAASLLWLFHPYDAGAADLLVHAAAIALVIVVLRVAGAAALRRDACG